MFKKMGLGIPLALVLVLAAGAFSVQAADPISPTPIPTPAVLPSFTDGRINAYDPGAPVAIFETHETVPIVNDNGVPTTAEVVNGVQLLFWDGASAKEVLNVPAGDIKAVIDKVNTSSVTNSTNNSNANNLSSTTNADSIVIAKSNGYTLNYSKTGYLWVSTPPDFEGKVYTFSWQKDF